jgi:hypothetical protein
LHSPQFGVAIHLSPVTIYRAKPVPPSVQFVHEFLKEM